MALTKNKNLRSLKQKTENMFLLSHGIRNANAYIEKQLYGFRFMGMSLDSWDNLSMQAMILCFLIGGLAAFGAYWYRCDSYYIVLYGTMGILAGLSLVLVDNGASISIKRQQLVDSLVDYVENSPHFYKTVDKSKEGFDSEKKVRSMASIQKSRLHDLGRRNLKAAEESAVSEVGEIGAGNDDNNVQNKGNFQGEKDFVGAVDVEKLGMDAASMDKGGIESGRLSVLSRKRKRKAPMIQSASSGNAWDVNGARNVGMGRGAGSPGDYESARRSGQQGKDDELKKSIEYLRQSLEQIAASREHMGHDVQAVKNPENSSLERAKKELRPEDLKLLGEILQEYLT